MNSTLACSTLQISNFKALASAKVSLGRITVLIGPNGSGKSSVLQTLTLLKQSLGQAALNTQGPIIDLGPYEGLVNSQHQSENISFALNLPCDPPSGFGPFGNVSEQRYEVTFREQGNMESQLLSMLPTVVGQKFEYRWRASAGGESFPQIQFGQGRGVNLESNPGVGHPISASLFGELNPEETVTLRAFFNRVASVLNDVYVVPPVRGFDATSYGLEDNPTVDLFATRSTENQASRVLSTIAYRRELEQQISDFSEVVLNVRLRARLMPNKRVAAEVVDAASPNLVNEGFGVNQLMILLAQLVLAPRGSIVGVEESEIHLHPLAQSRLAEIFVGLALRENKQLILTTHSEHLLLGLLSQVKRGAISHDELAVYYFDKKVKENPERLNVDDRGRLDGGLKGFFEANLNELEALLHVEDPD